MPAPRVTSLLQRLMDRPTALRCRWASRSKAGDLPNRLPRPNPWKSAGSRDTVLAWVGPYRAGGVRPAGQGHRRPDGRSGRGKHIGCPATAPPAAVPALGHRLRLGRPVAGGSAVDSRQMTRNRDTSADAVAVCLKPAISLSMALLPSRSRSTSTVVRDGFMN
jgi:hypothetical protein